MNLLIIRRIIGYVLILESLMLLLPCIVALIYGESQGNAYVAVSAICLVIGGVLGLKKPNNMVFHLKEGCVATALSWIVLSLFGCIPFVITGEIPNFLNALFETVSGFTTTGASILYEVESLSKCTLFWRSFTHWIGGMGVLVFIMAVIPLSGGSNINLLRAESPGPAVGKLAPKMRETARFLYLFYLGMTVAEVVLLLIGKVPLFEALTTAFGTAGTGGFGVKNDSIASFSLFTKWVITVFMMLFGVNFNAYFYLTHRQFKKFFSMEELRWYFGILLLAGGMFFYDQKMMHIDNTQALTDSAFQVASLMSSTGYSTANFDTWHQFSKCTILIIMFIGACAGSTGGGFKVSRFIVITKNAFREINYYIHPKSVKKIKMDGRPIENEVIRTTNTYFVTIVSVFVFSFFVLCLGGNDTETNFSAVLSMLNNIGPGLSKVGPAMNYEFYSPISKIILIIDMLAGRLEIYPMLLLFNPKLWHETVLHTNSRFKRKISK